MPSPSYCTRPHTCSKELGSFQLSLSHMGQYRVVHKTSLHTATTQSQGCSNCPSATGANRVVQKTMFLPSCDQQLLLPHCIPLFTTVHCVQCTSRVPLRFFRPDCVYIQSVNLFCNLVQQSCRFFNVFYTVTIPVAKVKTIYYSLELCRCYIQVV